MRRVSVLENDRPQKTCLITSTLEDIEGRIKNQAFLAIGSAFTLILDSLTSRTTRNKISVVSRFIYCDRHFTQVQTMIVIKFNRKKKCQKFGQGECCFLLGHHTLQLGILMLVKKSIGCTGSDVQLTFISYWYVLSFKYISYSPEFREI